MQRIALDHGISIASVKVRSSEVNQFAGSVLVQKVLRQVNIFFLGGVFGSSFHLAPGFASFFFLRFDILDVGVFAISFSCLLVKGVKLDLFLFGDLLEVWLLVRVPDGLGGTFK